MSRRSIRTKASSSDDAHLVGQVFLVALQLVVDDLLRTLVALDTFAREHLHVDHRAGNT